MTNDKDSAVLADKSDEYAIGHLSALLEVELHENGHTIGEDLAEKLAEIAVKTVRQPTQSDALREENERLRALLARTVNLAEVYAEGTGTNFKEAMAEARAALQGQSK